MQARVFSGARRAPAHRLALPILPRPNLRCVPPQTAQGATMPRAPARSTAQAVPVSPTANGMLGGAGWRLQANPYFASAALEAPIAAASSPPPLALKNIEPFGLGLPLGVGR